MVLHTQEFKLFKGQRFNFYIRGLKICSLNSSHTFDRVKTKETNIWLQKFKTQVVQFKENLSKIKELYHPKDSFLTVEYYWFVPKKEFFTTTKKAANGIKNCGDWSNFAKLPDDELFNRILKIDDSQVCKGTVYKLPYSGTDHFIKVVVGVFPAAILEKKAIQELPEYMK